MQEGEFFYCYNNNLFKFLKFDKGIKYMATGLNQNSQHRFWQFKRTDDLDKAIEEYKGFKVH